jgi:hypothetical protein
MLSLVEADRRDPTLKLLKSIGKSLGVPSAVLFAIALTDDAEDEEQTPLLHQLREITEQLLAAVQHTLVARRLQELRERR